MFRTRWPRICPQGRRLKPFDVPSANGSLGAPGHLRRQTNVRLTSLIRDVAQTSQMRRVGVWRGDVRLQTMSDKAALCPLDHVNRQFHAPAPNMLWVSDFTYVATGTGFVYVAFVIDTLARRIVGWRVSRTAHASFVLDALEQALHDRRPIHRGGLVHHSDRGSQYVSIRYTERLAEAGIEPSVGSVGDSTTTPSPKRSTVSTRPSSSIDADHGARSRPSSSRPWSGWTGSTIAGCWSPSATSRRPKPRNATTPRWKSQPWQRD